MVEQPERTTDGGHAPEISVVLAVRNMASTIETQFDALCRQDFVGPWELVVVDNASTDGTAAIAERWRSRLPLRIIHATCMADCGFAKNAGAAAAEGLLLAFCDGDDEVSPGWLRAMVGALGKAALVTGPLDARRLNAEKAADALEGKLPGGPEWLWAPGGGGNFGVWRRVFERLGGFPEGYGDGQDTALFWLAQLAGYQLTFEPAAVVHYRLKGDTRRAMLERYYRHGKASVTGYRRFREAGMPRSPARDVIYDWASVPVHVLRGNLYFAAQMAGWRFGRLVGSLRSRVLYL